MPGEGSQAADGTLSFEKVNPHKAPGPVGIPGGVLRACAPPSSTSEAATGNQQFHVAPTPDPSSHWPIEGRATHAALTHLEQGSTYCDLHHQSFETLTFGRPSALPDKQEPVRELENTLPPLS